MGFRYFSLPRAMQSCWSTCEFCNEGLGVLPCLKKKLLALAAIR